MTRPPSSAITPERLEQLKRDARRLRRGRTLSHSDALDAIAARHGYPNWSQLAKQVEGDLPPEPRDAPPQSRSAGRLLTNELCPTPLRMDATRTELALILRIVKRFEEVLGDDHEVDRFGLLMDLEACHCNACPLDLVALEAAPRLQDLVHDVAGINRHFNRNTGQLEDGFRPRYAAAVPALAATSAA